MVFCFREDDLIGKVTLSRKDMLMMNPSGREHWYSLSEVDSASEVHGHLHLKILACASVSERLKLKLNYRLLIQVFVPHRDVGGGGWWTVTPA